MPLAGRQPVDPARTGAVAGGGKAENLLAMINATKDHRVY